MATTAELLADAQAAYHKLVTGTAVVTVRDSNGETITYNQASITQLAAYIKSLEDLLNPCSRVNRPMRLFF